MIGSTDWVLSNRHNTMLVQAKEGDVSYRYLCPTISILCGLVDAPYAIPHHSHRFQEM
ncbi:MAG: hypothetical protein R2788_05695 [Saprospiraceae bacterium]